MSDKITFAEGYALPIGQHVDKKGKFSYLSWTHAVRYLRENYPLATWDIKENEHGVPMFPAGNGWLVKCTVTIDGLPFSQWHPILDFKNKAILEPNAFDVNTAIQRCLTKAIALATGIGLGLYAGEDLPVEKKELPPKKNLYASFVERIDSFNTIDEIDAWAAKSWSAVKKSMSDEEFGKAQSYLKQYKSMLENKGDKK